jgi:hypothetical protein
MGHRFSTFAGQRRWTALAGIAVILGLAVDLIVLGPAIVVFAVAVTTAVGWCVWLDAHSVR